MPPVAHGRPAGPPGLPRPRTASLNGRARAARTMSAAGELTEPDLRAGKVGEDRNRLTGRGAPTLATAAAAAAREAGDPCEKFSRATSMPAATSSSVRSRVAGPIVQTSFVRDGARGRWFAGEGSPGEGSVMRSTPRRPWVRAQPAISCRAATCRLPGPS